MSSSEMAEGSRPLEGRQYTSNGLVIKVEKMVRGRKHRFIWK